jgi:hypothetical protein
VLAIVGLIAATLVTLIAQPSSVEATHIQVFAYVFHPTGNTAYSSILECGWHTNCDGNFGDAQGGLDWRWLTTPGTTETRLRLKLLAGTNAHVANGKSINFGVTCPRVEILFQRISNGNLLGTIYHRHAKQPPGTVAYVWWAGTPAYQYDYFISNMVDPVDDDCSSFWHVMQEFISAPQTNLLDKNEAIPDEQGCYHCAASYYFWTTTELIFGFRAQ